MQSMRSSISSVLALIVLLPTGALLSTAQAGPLAPFAIGRNDFLLDGQPFVIRCGEMHFSRVPAEYWRDRLKMAKAMGLNTVCAYLFWNVHEPREGEFNFKDNADAAQFCRLAQQEGLHVILRPGPYSCAEWEFGGLPWWLLKTPDIKVRTQDPRYLDAAKKYLMAVGKQLAPLQITNGGPIIMVQVENEYGSYGSDKQYMGIVRDTLKEAGFNVPLFQCDGPEQLPRDHRDDLFAVVNFGGNPEESFAALRKVQPTGPLMCGEYYPGWFDHWGETHHTGGSERVISDLKYMLDHKESFSIYMAHGGTSFAFTTGANSPPFGPTVTSYDYDAPISEPGWDTPKFHQIRDLFSHYLQEGEALPPVPARAPVIAIPSFELGEFSPLLEKLPEPVRSPHPLTFETLDQPDACVLYRATLPAGPAARLIITQLHDYGIVYVNGQKIATLDRRRGQSTCGLAAREQAVTLDILVDSFGRVNYGPDIHDRKGITEKVELESAAGTTEVLNWSHYKLPLDEADHGHTYQKGLTGEPAFYRGSFELDRTGDTFLDTSKWNKGVVWVNGHNLGRYWQIGPQQTLYLPAPWLKAGRNEVVVYESNGATTPVLQGLTHSVLDQTHLEPDRAHRKAGQTIDLHSLTPTLQGTLVNNTEWQMLKFPVPAMGRYLTIEAQSSYSSDNSASLAEVYLQGPGGIDLPRNNWKVVYADSEEFSAENGSADNVFDLQATTFWHSQKSGKSTTGSHQIVIDLGENTEVSGLRVLQRAGAGITVSGRIKEFRIFVTPGLPPGI